MVASDNSSLGREAVKPFSVSFKAQINFGDLAVYSEEGQKVRYSILFLEPGFWIVSPRIPERAFLRNPKALYLTFGEISVGGAYVICGLSPLYRIFRANSSEKIIVPQSTLVLSSSLKFSGFVTESFFHICEMSQT